MYQLILDNAMVKTDDQSAILIANNWKLLLGQLLVIFIKVDRINQASTSSSLASRRIGLSQKTSMPVCQFFQTPAGCQMGASCRFDHISPSIPINVAQPSVTTQATTTLNSAGSSSVVVKNVRGFKLTLQKKGEKNSNGDTIASNDAGVVVEKESDRVPARASRQSRRVPVQKPQPKTLESMLEQCASFEERARVMKSHQVDSLLKRFHTNGAKRHTTEQGKEYITLSMPPSDPDFAFDLEALHVVLQLNRFPSERDAQLQILNPEIPPDLKLNIQKAFARKQRVDTNDTLVDLFKWLDKELEGLLITNTHPQNDSIGIIALVKPSEASEVDRRAFYGNGGAEDSEDEGERANASDESATRDNTDEMSGDDEVTGEEEKDFILQDTTKLLQKKGTSIRFVNLNLVNISLLSPHMVSVSVKCQRCKTNADFLNIKPNGGSGDLEWASKSCVKCSEIMVVNFRPDLVHLSNSQLGFLDCVSCTLQDILPSKLLATCAQCDATQTPNACFETIGSSVHCRECHSVMTLGASQFKFVTLQAPVQPKSAVSREKKMEKKQKREGLSIGTALPQNGVCVHYKKSYRWFRFPCCGKLFACDICHENANSDAHEMQWATRQVCGFCSREQVYSATKTCVCGKDLVRKDHGGFWEGGKGTREKGKMNRNDSHKFKGLNKTVSNKAKDKLI